MKKIIPFRKEISFKTNINEITSISLEHQLTIDNLNIVGEFIVSGDYKMSNNSTTVESFDINIPFEISLDEKYDTSKATCDIDDFYYEIINNSVLSLSIDVCIDRLSEILIKNDLPNLEEKKDIIEELFEEKNIHENDEDKQEQIVNDDYRKVEISSNTKDYNDIQNTSCTETDRCIEDEEIITNQNNNKLTEDELMINQKEDKMNEVEVKHAITDNNNFLVKEEVVDVKESVNDKINSLFNNVDDVDAYVSYNVYIIREGDTVESIIEKYATNEEELKKYNNLSDLKLGDKLIIPAVK